MTYVLGFDIGTTSTIGILIRLPATVVGLASRPVDLVARHAGWAEEDPEQWWANVGAISRELIATAGIAASDIGAIGVAGMLPAVVLLDDTDKLLRLSIQQSDGRDGAEVGELKAEYDETAFIARAGNGINQQLVTAKLRWIEKHEPEVFARIATVFGSYDFINFRLTGQRSVEQNWALEAGFVEVGNRALADDLIALAHIRREVVPELHASHEIIGRVTPEAARFTGLAAGTPVVAGAADHIASAYAAGVVGPGDILLKFGGAIDILVAADKAAPDPRLYLDFHLLPGQFMPNGCMATGGSGLNWFAANLGGGQQAEAEARGLSIHQYLDSLAEAVPAGSDGLLFLPYFLGEKTPIHDPALRGTLTGLSLIHGIGQIWRALLEGYGYAIAHHVEVLGEMGHHISRFLVSDGGANSRVWMGIVADILQRPLLQLTGHPGSSLGAAWTAAMGAGLVDDWAGVNAFIGKGAVIAPNPQNAAAYAAGYRQFRDLHARLKGFER